jgi:hypothetical protein
MIPAETVPTPVHAGHRPALYLSRKLDYFTVSADSVPLYAPVVLIGSTPYYRIAMTPCPVLAWFERTLYQLADNPRVPLAERTHAAQTWWRVVIPFAQEHDPDLLTQLQAARSLPSSALSLPPAPEVPAELAPRVGPVPKQFTPMRKAG